MLKNIKTIETGWSDNGGGNFAVTVQVSIPPLKYFILVNITGTTILMELLNFRWQTIEKKAELEEEGDVTGGGAG